MAALTILLRRFKARRAIRRMIPTLSHDAAALGMRRIAYSDHLERDRELALAFAVRAAATAPPELKYAYENWVRALRRGGRIKVATGEVTAVDGVDVRTIDEINSATAD